MFRIRPTWRLPRLQDLEIFRRETERRNLITRLQSVRARLRRIGAESAARLERPIPFEAIDDQPVDLMFVLLAPAEAGAEHLRALARVSRLLRDATICQKLRGTDNADALYALLTDRTESHAA